MDKKLKIIIDTDIGDDIDDALAISLALHAPGLDLIGVTTVYQNTDLRAKQVKALLTSYHRTDIPVCKGEGTPLSMRKQLIGKVWEDTKKINCQYEPDVLKYDYEKEDAVDFIIRMIRQYPHEITLLPIGALTNIAIAMQKAPDIIPLIKEIRLMGGVFFRDFAEWNILCDPIAADVVFTCGAKVYAVGLDVTEQCLTKREDIEAYMNKDKPESDVLQRMLKAWLKFTGKDKPVLHDPLTVCTLIQKDYVTFEQKNVKILLGEENAGITRILTSPDAGSAEIEIGTKVKAEEFVEFFTRTVLV